MKKLLLCLAVLAGIWLTPSTASAQCNGVFPAATACGNAGASPNTPRPVAAVIFATGCASGAFPVYNGTVWTCSTDPNSIATLNGGPLSVNTSGANQGILATHPNNITGSIGATAFAFNKIFVQGEGIGADPLGQVMGLEVVMNAGGASLGGTHYAFLSFLNNNVSSTGPNLTDFVSAQFLMVGSVNDGGTNTGAGARGTLFATNPIVQAQSGATNLLEVSGGEVDVQILTGASAKLRFGWSIVDGGNVQGAGFDAALAISSAGGPGWHTGFLFGKTNGTAPFDTGGSVIASDGAGGTVAYFFNAPDYAATSAYFNFNNYVLSGTGLTTIAEIAAPSSPSATLGRWWYDSTDHRFHDKNSSGTIGTTVVADTGAANNFLTAISVAGVISKAQPSFANISGTAAVTQGGTGLTSFNQGDTLYASAANTLSALAKNTTATRYLANTGASNNPAWDQIDLTNGVKNALPVANGGTNCSSASITCFNNITGFSAAGTTGTTSTNLVFSASPSFTGTVTMPDSATWTSAGINSLTALGVGTAAPATGIRIANAWVTPTGNGQLALGANATNGANIGGQGSSNDFILLNKSGQDVCHNATGTQTLNCTTLTLTNPLAVAQGGTGYTGGGFPTTTPACNPVGGPGTFACTATMDTLQVGKLVCVTGKATVTNVGTATSFTVAYPVAAKQSVPMLAFGSVTGFLYNWYAGSSQFYKYDGTIPAPVVQDYIFTGCYEAA